MASFAYSALDAQGRQTTGSLAAENRAEALAQVTRMGLHPVQVAESGAPIVIRAAQGPAPKRIPRAEVEAFTRGLSNLLAAGVPLSRALQILSREAAKPAARAQWAAINEDVVGGMPLADALARWPRSFPPVYVAMVRAGETGGFLDVVLAQIADFQVREQDLKGRVKAALVYPAVLATVAIGVVIFLMLFFIPRFSKIFAEFGSALPLLTRVIVAISRWVSDYALLMAIVAVAATFLVRRVLSTDAGRRGFDFALLRTPGVGRVMARFSVVRFCRMLGTLIGAGVPLVSALRVAREAIGHQTLADAVTHSVEAVQRGSALSRSLASCPQLFPPSIVEMVAVAEESGKLDKELIRMAGVYESELDRQLRMLVSLAEPALLFIMAAVIGTIVVGMFLPIFSLQDLIH